MKIEPESQNSDLSLSEQEVEKLTTLLAGEEQHLSRVYDKLNGGFVESIIHNYDRNVIDVEMNYGVQGGKTYSEDLQVCRKKMGWLN